MKTKLLFLITFLAMAGGSAFAQSAAPIVGGNISASSTNCTTSFSCVWESALPANAGTTTINIAGTFSATLLVEESNNGGQSWSTAATLSSVGTTTYSTNGFTDIRVRCSAFTSGSAAVTISTGLLQVQSVVTVQGSSSGGGPNLPIPQSTVGPGFNVKNYGAKGDTQFSTANCTTVNGQATISCPGANFSAAANIGQRANCGSGLGGGLFFATGTTITGVNSSTVAVLSNTTGVGGSTASCAWGTVDDVAVAAAVTAWKAAVSSVNGQGQAFNNANSPASPVLYFPAGAYMLCSATNTAAITMAANKFGAVIQGDAPQESWLVPCDTPANAGASGFMINQPSGSNGLVIKNISVDGIFFPIPASANAIQLIGGHNTENVTVTRWNGGNGFSSQSFGYNLNLVVNSSLFGIFCSQCNDEFHSGGTSNNGSGGAGYNLKIQNAIGLNINTGPRFTGNFIVDECGTSINGCTQIVNSQDVWFQGSSLFSTPASNALYVDGTSVVHLSGGIVGVFGNDTSSSGLKILAGGLVQASDVRFSATGSGNCINNAGVFNDNGGNSCETQFPIVSGTSTTTTAVLTVTPSSSNVNTLCTVGDSLVVEGATIAGYNGYYTFGITAVGTNTITYTTIGSNLGALGAGGTASCRNLQTFTGNLPKALLNNPIPNTCYVTITPIVNATTYLLCNFRVQSATNITRIMASSQTTTTCATAPIITISDGTASQTLTLTSAKSSWDSAVDASTGVGTTIFKPNGTITVKYDVAAASTCATPPTQLAISYNISPILSN